MSNIEFDTPANRIIAQQQPRNQFTVNTSLPDLTFLRQLSVQGRLRFFTADGSDITITPNVGETIFVFRFLISNAATAQTDHTFINAGVTRMVVTVPSLDTVVSDIMDSLVGDGVKTMTLNVEANTQATILAWSENTSRIRDVTI